MCIYLRKRGIKTGERKIKRYKAKQSVAMTWNGKDV